MRRRYRSKYKQTFLSSLFIELFFFAAGRALAPVPVVGTLFDIIAQEI